MKNRPVVRGKGLGNDAVYSAAYRGGRSLWNERTGDLYKWQGREDVRDVGIVLPQALAQDPRYEWAKDPYKLWNTAEFAEFQHNSRVARDYTVVLPDAMTSDQRRAVVYQYAQALADRYGNAVDVALHDRRTGRARNYHAHLLATTRKLGPQGLLEKTDAEVVGRDRGARGLTDSYSQEQASARNLWEALLKEAMREAGLPNEAYRKLYREYGRGETTPEYHKRLIREGYDLRKQRREDRRKTQLTPAERQQSAAKKWAIRKYLQIQERARHARVLANQRRASKPGAQRPADYQKKLWMPRWDARTGLLDYWQIEAQIRTKGQPQSLFPLIAKANPGPEPEYVPEAKPASRPARIPEPEKAPPALQEAPPAPADNALEAGLTGVDAWLEYRRSKGQDPNLRVKDVDSWLEYRRTKASHPAQTDAVQVYLDYWREKRQQEAIQKERKQERANLPAPNPHPRQPSPQRQPTQEREHSQDYELKL